MIEPEDLEWRMYGIVPYNISDIQKGIQFGHAVQEYNNLMLETISNMEEADMETEFIKRPINPADKSHRPSFISILPS